MEFEGICRRSGLTSRFGGAFGPGFGACWALGSGGGLAGGMFCGLWAGGRPVLGCQSPQPGSTRGNPSHERRVSAGVRVGFAGRFGSLQLNRGRANPVESEVGLGEVEAPAPGGLVQATRAATDLQRQRPAWKGWKDARMRYPTSSRPQPIARRSCTSATCRHRRQAFRSTPVRRSQGR